jgi:hypothetical protein
MAIPECQKVDAELCRTVMAVSKKAGLAEILKAPGRRLSESRMRENLMSGSMWQGMETRHTMPRRHSLTLPRGRLDSHRQTGFFRGFGFCPFRGQASSLQPPVTRAVGRLELQIKKLQFVERNWNDRIRERRELIDDIRFSYCCCWHCDWGSYFLYFLSHPKKTKGVMLVNR